LLMQNYKLYFNFAIPGHQFMELLIIFVPFLIKNRLKKVSHPQKSARTTRHHRTLTQAGKPYQYLCVSLSGTDA
jgi:hypothetical protein